MLDSILFRVDAGTRVGMGHLRRCLILANEARKRHIPVDFLLYGDAGAARQVFSAGFPCVHREATSLKTQLEESGIPGPSHGVGMVMDCLTADNLAEPEALSAYLELWHEHVENLTFIDGGMPMAMRHVVDAPSIDVLVAPYVGEQPISDADYVSLCGPSYYPLPDSFQLNAVREVPEVASRILVTCGGSDVNNITPLVLKGLDLVGRDLEIRVVAGPLFRNSQIAEISTLASGLGHDVRIESDPHDMAALMSWADMAIATSGLTKYELAAAGTPAILISIDADHEAVNRQFLTAGTAISLGICGKITAPDVMHAVGEIIVDRIQRKRMSEAGQTLVDGRGSERIIDIMTSNNRTSRGVSTR